MKIKIILSLLILFTPSLLFASIFQPSNCEEISSTDLIVEMTNQVNSRIEGLSSSDTFFSLFTDRSTSTGLWTKNPNVWTTRGLQVIDFSGRSVWNSTGEYQRAGTLISPRHIIFANHFPIDNGSTIVFVDRNGSIVSRILQSQDNVNGTDVQIGLLDSDVPDTVAYYPIFSRDQLNKYMPPRGIFSNGDIFVPVINIDQEDRIIIRNYSGIGGINNDQFVTSDDFLNGLQSLFFSEYINGDSGSPGFFIVDDQPILTYIAQYPLSGDFSGNYIDDINLTMSSLQGGDNPYQVSLYNLSCFDEFDNSYVFYINEMLPEGTLIGSVNSTSTFQNATVRYSIISGDDNNIFNISSSTGEIYVLRDDLIDYETNQEIELVVQAVESVPCESDPLNCSIIYYSSVPVIVNILDLNESINFSEATYNFSVNEHSSINTTIGSILATSSISNSISFEIVSGDDNNIFNISSSTGLITVNNSLLLDYENHSTFNLVVSATDDSVARNSQTVNVVININDISNSSTSQEWLYNRSLYRNWTADGYAWGENVGWIKFSPSPYTTTYVSDSGLTGYIYGESVGWISLSCRNTDTCDFVNYGVVNDGSGNLSGYAWGENVGWIDFGLSTSSYKVSISESGVFSGYAYGEAIGYINFNTGIYSATTTGWVSRENRAECDDGLDNDNDGRIDYPDDINCSSLVDNREKKSNTYVVSNYTEEDNKKIIDVEQDDNHSEESVVKKEYKDESNNDIVKTKDLTNVSREFLFNSYLKKGSVGEEVKKLQNFLMALGYILPSGSTGYFGNETEKALSKYQSDNNIISTGTLGPITRNYINNLSKKDFVYDKYIFVRNLELNSIGEDVRQLQVYLNNNGFIVSETGIGSKGNESTFYGEKTKKAVEKLQETYKEEILIPYGFKAGTGMFYEITRKWVNAH